MGIMQRPPGQPLAELLPGARVSIGIVDGAEQSTTGTSANDSTAEYTRVRRSSPWRRAEARAVSSRLCP